jgi:phenol hydroxylase P4 protein
MAMVTVGEYPLNMMDSVDKFHGNQLVYVGWDNHRLINSAMTFPLPAEMPFGALVHEVMPSCYKDHPDFEKVNFEDGSVIWNLNGESFTPDFSKSLIENGVDHKSLIRFETPNLTGLNGVGM